MSALSRRRFQRIALWVIGGLVVLVGIRQAAAAASHLFQVDHDVRVERHHRGAHPHEKRIERHVIRRQIAQTSRRDDVIFAETFAVREGEKLVVDLSSESVDIRRARGLEATVTVRGEGRRAREALERKRFSARHQRGVLTVRTDPPRSWRVRGRQPRLSVVIEIPARFEADIDVGSGAVRVDRLAGDLRVDTGSGAIQVGSARGGEISLDTGSGAVRADELEGEVSIDTGSGSIQLGRVTGSFDANTGSGSVRVDRADVREFDASTGSGSITASLARAGDISAESGSGSIDLTLPRGARADVDLSGSRVDIDGALDFRGESSRRRARGTIGGGGERIRA